MAYLTSGRDKIMGSSVSTDANVVTVIDDTCTDEQVPSALATKAYVDNKEVKISTEENNKIEIKDDGIFVSKDYVEITQAEYDLLTEEEKKDIVFYIKDATGNSELVTVIDENSTDEEIPSAKAVHTAIQNVSGGVPVNAYTKEEVNDLLDEKANTDDIVDAYDKTEVDGLLADKVNVSSVVLTLSSANTDEEIPSAKAVYTYVDNKEVKISAEEDNKIEIKDDGIFIGKDYVEITQAEYDLLTEEEKKDIVFYITDTNINDNNNTTNIVTIIDENCTDEQVPSAKAVYNALDNVSTGVPIDVYSKTEVNDLLDDKVDISSLESMCLHSYHVNSINGTGTDNLLGLTQKTLSHIKTTTSQLSSTMILFDSSLDSTNFFGLPNGNFAIVWIKTSSDKDMIIAQEPNTSSFYICTNINSQTWRKPLMTSIQDESLTTVSLSSTEFCTGSIQYEVKNGICYLYMRLDGTGVSTNQAFKVFATGVPKPSANHFVVINDMNDTGFSCTLAISTTSDIGFACNSTTAGRYYGNFSYPVAE